MAPMTAASPQMIPTMLNVAPTATLFAKKPLEAAPVGEAKTVDVGSELRETPLFAAVFER